MNNLKIFFNNSTIQDKLTSIYINNNKYIIEINVRDILNYTLVKEINKIKKILDVCDNLELINILFNKNIDSFLINVIITKLSNILYCYKPKYKIKLYSFSIKDNKINYIENTTPSLMNELILYKDIVMNPNKDPENYLEYVKSRVPRNYNIQVNNLNIFKKFPLTESVGKGSRFNTYFVHIKPNLDDPLKKTIFLVGKSVTFDSGGLNLKTNNMEEMKTDMAGSAIIISVLNTLVLSGHDEKFNIHLLIPIVENMISNTATRPGQIIKSCNSISVEITNTDAEGRLCLADCLEYINNELLTDNCLIIDIATLTGNAVSITSEIASISMCNKKGEKYKDKLIQIGEDVGEYLEYLQLRPEYLDLLKSPVADIKNLNLKTLAGCIIGGAFLHRFATNKCPWIHLDVAPTAFINQVSTSYGVNLLVEFIKQL